MPRKRRPKVVVLGMMSKIPVAGVVWQTLHYLHGFRRLGLDPYYVEAHARTPSMLMTNDNDDASALAADFIGSLLNRHELGDRWAFQALHAGTQCYGMSERALHALYRDAAIIINLHGGTLLLPEHVATGRLVYLETDPVLPQIELHDGVTATIDFLDQHCAHFTFAENYGAPTCTLPTSDLYEFHPTRQPVVLDWWSTGPPPDDRRFTTIANWYQPWRNVNYGGRVYGWSKHESFQPFMDLPASTSADLELALANCDGGDQATLVERGWHLRSAEGFSSDIDGYRRYIQESSGEFSVAKEQNVAFRTGWFSDRSATYLASGRPVVMQDTGFGEALPTGCGLVAFSTPDEAASALEAVQGDYDRHAAGAREIARSHFSHEVVLGAMLEVLDIPLKSGHRPQGQGPPPRPVGGSAPLGPSLVVPAASKRPTRLDPSTVKELGQRRRAGICVGRRRTTERPPEVSIVVPVYNRVYLTQLCLESMLSQEYPSAYEIVVMDDGSTDETRDYLAMVKGVHPQVRVVTNPTRAGFGRAVNLGIAQCRGATIVIANNDTIVGPGWMAGLIAHLEDPVVGMAVASTSGHSRNCRVAGEFRTYNDLQYLAAARLSSGPHQRSVSMAPLFFAALRREVIDEIGPLDEQFEVAMFEDDDYCARLKGAGYSIVCALDVFVHHYGEGTLGELYADAEFHKVFVANRARFERKWDRIWDPTEDDDEPNYRAVVDDVRALLNTEVPAGNVVAVVSRGDDDLITLNGPEGWHLPRTPDGSYLGAHPADSDDAIAAVDAARADGAGWLFLPRPYEWWLNHYDTLECHLVTIGQLTRDHELGRLYRLNPPNDRKGADVTLTADRTASACTIISRNYLGQARVLASSYLTHHPDGRFYLLIVDGLPEGVEIDPRIKLVRLSELPLDNLGDMCFKYDVVELATAVKPALLMLLTVHHREQRVMYIDPDIRIARPMTEVFDALDHADIVLTPHLNAPIPLDGRTPREQDILISGAYNLGFIALRQSSESARLLEWWRERLDDLCRVDPTNGLMVDQRWIDLVPSLFPSSFILRDDTYNVAYWNLHARHIERSDDGYTCNGRPLAMFHFSGYNPERPDVISKHQNRTALIEGSALRSLFDAYGQSMLDAGFLECKQLGYGLASFDNGIGLHSIFRRLYHDLAEDRRRFGDPLAAGGDHSFYAWATTQDPGRRNLSPFLEMAYRLRYDIQVAFPDVGAADRTGFLAWAVGQGASEFGYEPEVALRCDGATPSAIAGDGPALVPARLPEPVSPGRQRPDAGPYPGVNVCGYLRNESGIGAAARAYIRILEHLEVPMALRDVSELSVNRSEDTSIGSFHDDHSHPVNLVCINADQHFVVMAHDPGFFEGKYNIGVWFWEMPSFPDEWRDRFAYYDEIWVGSSYIANTLAQVSPIPVVRILPELGVQGAGDRQRGRERLGATDEFVFLFMFDFHSYIERKNPMAIIEAFRGAFPSDEQVRLVIKSVNGSSNAAGLAGLESAAAGDGRITFLNEYVSAADIADLTQACDCYVSLHRAEGTGLTMAHAMAAGKPVVATGWSGNTDFMDSSNSLLVRFDLVELDRDIGPYKLGGFWADPDIEHAGALMRHVFEHPDEAAALGDAARESVMTRFSAERVGRAASDRLQVIADRLTVPRSPWPPIAPEHSGNPSLMGAIRAIVARHALDERPVIVVSKGDPVLVELGDREAWHFPQNDDGVYAGYYPSDSAVAIAHLEQLRQRGAGYFLVPSSCRWWLQHYGELRDHLETQYQLEAEDASCVLYRLDTVDVPEAANAAEARLHDLGAQIEHLSATLAATGAWVEDLAPRVADSGARIEAIPSVLGTAFSTVVAAISDIESDFDGRVEGLERTHEHLSGLLATTGVKLDEFAVHVEASRQLHESRQRLLDERLDRRLGELAEQFGDQATQLGAHVSALTARVCAFELQAALGSGPSTRTTNTGQIALNVRVPELGAGRKNGSSIEAHRPDERSTGSDMACLEHQSDGMVPTASNGSHAGEAVERLEHRLGARPYTSTNRFSTEDPDQPMGFSRSDGSEDERVARPTFADVFRGESSFIAERQRIYLPFFSDCVRVADLGSGRGEFLDLLAEAGITAEGVEQDGPLVRACRRRGLTVHEQDALTFLEEIDPASLDGVFSAQCIEHIDPARLRDMVVLARRALRQGGTFVAETVNPENYEALKTFHIDLTHQRPIFPQVLLHLCWEAGFEAAWVFYPLGGGFTQRHYDTVGEYAVVARA
jgi:GT2 family glycosyltransferase/glycosyltransferase involved in cell wall biosynthesis